MQLVKNFVHRTKQNKRKNIEKVNNLTLDFCLFVEKWLKVINRMFGFNFFQFVFSGGFFFLGEKS